MQESKPGPILFIIFINDLPSVLKHAECLRFADRIKIYRRINCSEILLCYRYTDTDPLFYNELHKA